MFSNREWNSVVEQVLEVEFFSVGVGFCIYGISEVTDNPDIAGKPWRITPFLMFYKHYSLKSLD